MAADNAGNMEELVNLLSRDGEFLPISLKALNKSVGLRHFYGMTRRGGNTTVQVPVPGAELRKVISFLEHHGDDLCEFAEYRARLKRDEVDPFDRSLVQIERDELLKIRFVADYLRIEHLLDLCCWAIARKCKDMTVEQRQRYFNVTSDYTQEEMEQLLKENEARYGKDKERK